MLGQNSISNIYKDLHKNVFKSIFQLPKPTVYIGKVVNSIKFMIIGMLIATSILSFFSNTITNSSITVRAADDDSYEINRNDTATNSVVKIEGGVERCWTSGLVVQSGSSDRYCFKTDPNVMGAYSDCGENKKLGGYFCNKEQPLYYVVTQSECKDKPNETGVCIKNNGTGTYNRCVKSPVLGTMTAIRCSSKTESTEAEKKQTASQVQSKPFIEEKNGKVELSGRMQNYCSNDVKTCIVDGTQYDNCVTNSEYSNGGANKVTCDKSIVKAETEGKFKKENGRPFQAYTDQKTGITCELYFSETGVGDKTRTNNAVTVENQACGQKDANGKWVYSETDTQNCTSINTNNGTGRDSIQINCSAADKLNFADGSIDATFLDSNSTIILKDLEGRNITLSFDDIKYQFCVRDNSVLDRIGDVFTLNARDITEPSRLSDRCKYYNIKKADFLAAISKFCQGLATGLPNASKQSDVDVNAEEQKVRKCNNRGANVKIAETRADIKNDPTKSIGMAGLPSDTSIGKASSDVFGGLLKYLFNIVLAIVYIMLLFIKYLQMTVLLIIASIMASLLNLNPTTSFLLNIGQPLWNIFANIANLGAVFIIIYLGAATMIGIMKSEEAIKNGTAVAIYVLISQFTYLGIAFVVGLVDSFSKLLVAVFAKGDIFNIFLAVFQSLQGMNVESGELLPGGKSVGSTVGVIGKAFTGGDVTGVVIGEALTLIMLMFLMMGFFKYFVMVVMRTTVLMGLMITSPLWVLGYLAKDSLPDRFKKEIDKIPDLLTGAVIFNLAFVGLMILLGTFASQVITGLTKVTVASGGTGLLESVQVKGIGIALIIGFMLKITEILEGLIPPDLAAIGSSIKKWGDNTLKNIATGNTAELVKSISGGAGSLITGNNETVTNLASAGLKVTGGQAIINKGIRMQAKASYDKSNTRLTALQEQRKKLIDAGDINGAQALDQDIANVQGDIKNARTRFTDNKTLHQRAEDLVNNGQITGVDARTVRGAVGTVAGGLGVATGAVINSTPLGRGLSTQASRATRAVGNALGNIPVVGGIRPPRNSFGDANITSIDGRERIEAEVIAKNEQDQMRLDERNRREADLQLQLTAVNANLATPGMTQAQTDAYNMQRDSIQAQIDDYQSGVTQMVVNADGTTSSRTVIPTTNSLATGITNRTNTSGVNGNQIRVTIPSSPIREAAARAAAASTNTTTAAAYPASVNITLNATEQAQYNNIIAGFTAGGNTPMYGDGVTPMDEIGQALAALQAMGKR